MVFLKKEEKKKKKKRRRKGRGGGRRINNKMAINTYLSIIESKKQNEQREH